MVNFSRFCEILVEVSLNTPAQLSLPLYLPDDETFASFWPGDNSSLLAALQNVLRQEHSGYIYLWAREGAGRSHLLARGLRGIVTAWRCGGLCPAG